MVYTTFASRTDAERVGEKVVEEELAACVNILPGMVSIYHWQGEIVKDDEVVMLVKSRLGIKTRLVDRLGALHPYDTPVIFVIEGEACGDKYWQWLLDRTGADTGAGAGAGTIADAGIDGDAA